VKYTHAFIAAVFCSIQSDAMDHRIERSLSQSTPSIPIDQTPNEYPRRHSTNNLLAQKEYYRCADEYILVYIKRELESRKQQCTATIINICANTASEDMTPEAQSKFEEVIRDPLFDPNYQCSYTSPFIAACSSANVLFVRSLLSANADPSKKIGDFCTSFSAIISSKASLDNQIACINELIDGGANPHQTIKSGHTILHTAAKKNPALLPYLLELETVVIDVNTVTDTQKTPLLLLIRHGWNKPPIKEPLRALILHGADPHKQDYNGNSAISLAKKHVNSKILRWIHKAQKKYEANIHKQM
jgi:ankyrin repeat protein